MFSRVLLVDTANGDDIAVTYVSKAKKADTIVALRGKYPQANIRYVPFVKAYVVRLGEPWKQPQNRNPAGPKGKGGRKKGSGSQGNVGSENTPHKVA